MTSGAQPAALIVASVQPAGWVSLRPKRCRRDGIGVRLAPGTSAADSPALPLTVDGAKMSLVDRLKRHRERGCIDRRQLDVLLDEVPFGVLATVSDGNPWQVPLLFARDGDRLLLHGSTGAGALRQAGLGGPVSFAVTAFDGLVVAHSTFDSSANYRSAVIRGSASALNGMERKSALDVLSDRLIPGRSREVRPTEAKERAATVVLALPIEDGSWLMKSRTGGPGPADAPHDAWTGVVPARMMYDDPEPEPDSVNRPVPASVRSLLTAGFPGGDKAGCGDGVGLAQS